MARSSERRRGDRGGGGRLGRRHCEPRWLGVFHVGLGRRGCSTAVPPTGGVACAARTLVRTPGRRPFIDGGDHPGWGRRRRSVHGASARARAPSSCRAACPVRPAVRSPPYAGSDIYRRRRLRDRGGGRRRAVERTAFPYELAGTPGG